MELIQAQKVMEGFIKKFQKKYPDTRKVKIKHSEHSSAMYRIIDGSLGIRLKDFGKERVGSMLSILGRYEDKPEKLEDYKSYKQSQKSSLDIFYNLQDIKQAYPLIRSSEHSNKKSKQILNIFWPLIYKGGELQLQYRSRIEYVLENHDELLKSLDISMSGLESAGDNEKRLLEIRNNIKEAY